MKQNFPFLPIWFILIAESVDTQNHDFIKMTPNLIKNIPEGKQFRLVKYFALASFIVLVIFSFPFSVFISQKAKDTLTKSYEDYAIQLANNLHQQVLYKFSYPVLEKYDGIRLSDKTQQALMDRVIKDAIYGHNIDVVNAHHYMPFFYSFFGTKLINRKKLIKRRSKLRGI